MFKAKTCRYKTAEPTLSIAGSIILGTLDEKSGITGLGFTSKSVIAGPIDAVGSLFQFA